MEILQRMLRSYYKMKNGWKVRLKEWPTKYPVLLYQGANMIFKRFCKHIKQKHIFLDLPQSLTWLDTPVCWDQGSLLPQEVRPRNLQHWDLQWPHHGHCNCSQVLTTWTGQWWATTTTAGLWDTPVTRSLTLSSELSVMRSKHQIKFNTSILYN